MDGWQLIIISFHNDVFTCHRAEVKTKEHKERYKKTSNRYKLEKGSRLAVVTVAMGRNIGQYGGRACAFRP